MERYKRIAHIVMLILVSGVALAFGQESQPGNVVTYQDEPDWVHEKPPKLDDRIWHAKPAAAEAKLEPLKRVRVVDYGDNYIFRHVESKTGFGRMAGFLRMTKLNNVEVDGVKDGQIQYREFSMDSKFPRSGRAPAQNIERDCQPIYGGFVAYMAGTKGGWQIIGGFPCDNTVYFRTAPGGTPTRAYSLWLWKKEDFRYGGDTYNVSFDETSRLGVTGAGRGYDEMRYVVKDGDQYYITEYNFGTQEALLFADEKRDQTNPTALGLSKHTQGEGGVVWGMDPAETRWAKFYPKAPYDIVFDSKKATFEKHTFSDIQVAGFYLGRNNAKLTPLAYGHKAFEMLATVHRKPRPSETLDMAKVSGQKDEKGKSIPDFHISKCEIPYVLFNRVSRWGLSGMFAFDEFYPYMTISDGDMGSMDYGPDGDLKEHGSDEPVTDIRWLDAMAWCNMLSEYEGREPVYYMNDNFSLVQRKICHREVFRLHGDLEEANFIPYVHVKWDADGYRLPTAAEWQAAAGDALALQSTAPWIGSNAKDTTHDVGTSKPNEFGIYDMYGNAWEYIWDVGGMYDPSPEEFKARHTVLGGDFNFPANPMKKLGNPYGDEPHKGHFSIGFRVVRREKGLAKPPLAMTVAKDVPSWTITQGEKSKGKELDLHENVLEMVTCKEGSYIRGDTAEVFVSESFFAETEITYRQWKKVRDWAVHRGYLFNYDGDMGSMDYKTWKYRHGPDEPVAGISTYDIYLWCNALSQMEGRKPSYFYCRSYNMTYNANMELLRKALPIRNRWDRDVKKMKIFEKPELRFIGWKPGMKEEDCIGSGNPKRPAGVSDIRDGLGSYYNRWTQASVDWSTDGYRLPTLAEWSVACQAGVKDTPYYWGHEPDLKGKYAWSWHNSEGRTHPVKLKPPNSRGLYDMQGNVWDRIWSEGTTNWQSGGGAVKGGQASKETWNPKGGYSGYIYGVLTGGGSFMESTIDSVSDGAFNIMGGNQSFRHAILFDWSGHPGVGFRPVRCAEDTHRVSGSELPEVILVLDVNLKQVAEPLQGQTHRGNLQRTGLLYGKGVRKTPKVKWKFESPSGQIKSCPLVYKDQVYIATKEGILYALNVDTGKEIWTFKMAGGPVGELGMGYDGNIYPSAPTIKDGLLYIGCQRGEGGWAHLYVIDVRTGKAKLDTTFRNTKAIYGSPIPAYGAIFARSVGWQGGESGLMAMHGETGQLLNIYRTMNGGKGSMSFAEGTLVAGHRFMDLRSGSVRGGIGDGVMGDN